MISLCGVIGSREDAIKIKADIKEYLESKLRLELSEEKTLVTYSNNPGRSTGFEIRKQKCAETRRDTLEKEKVTRIKRLRFVSLKIGHQEKASRL